MFITDNVYLIDATKGSYAFALHLDDGITLIDTSLPGRGPAIATELETHQLDDVKRILLTHHDVDHVGSAAWLQQHYGCDVFISATDMPYVLGSSKRHGVKRVIGALIKVRVPENLQTLPDGSIDGIQIVPTPGHTPGHTCYLWDGVLFAGDLLHLKDSRVTKPSPLMTWDAQQVDSSVAALGDLAFQWVCPAHGEPVQTSHVNN